MKYLHERRKALGGYLPHRRTKADEQLAVPPLDTFKAVLEPTAEGPRDLDHAGLRALPDPAAARQGARPARGADPGRRGAHLRHGGPVPPDRHLQPGGPELHAGRQGPGHVLPRGQGRPDPAGRHQRAGRHEQLDRRGDVVLDEQPHHGAVLRVLLDVRLPAHRRPGLGGRRHAGARLPARRHLGPHHAQRRRPAARGRPQPHPGRHDPELHQLRPDLRARGRRDPAPRPEAHGREAGQRLLLPDAAQRELRRSRGCAPAPRNRSSRACTCCRKARRRRRASTCSAAARSCARAIAAQRAARERLGRRRQRLELPELQRAGARRPGRRALEPAPPDREAARRRSSPSSSRSTPAR